MRNAQHVRVPLLCTSGILFLKNKKQQKYDDNNNNANRGVMAIIIYDIASHATADANARRRHSGIYRSGRHAR